MGNKKKLTEGRIRKWLDKIIYSIVNKENEATIERLKNDPTLEKHLSDYEEKTDELKSILGDFFQNPEKYNISSDDK